MDSARHGALDALRGLAIAGMLFSGLLPYRVLPGWMYHAQNPPPTHAFAPAMPGISWVDLVFPLFLFALGVALPLALARARSAGAAAWGLAQRFVLLIGFALYSRHISPHVAAMGAPWLTAVYALAGLALLFPMLGRLDERWSRRARLALRVAGFGGAAALMLLFRDAGQQGFSLSRADPILLVLANVSLTGGLLWLATRERLAWRLVVLGLLLALRLTHTLPGWGQLLWNASPLPALAPVAMQQYLFVVIPGTIAGDVLLRWSRPPPSRRLDLACLCCAALVLTCVVGLYARWWVATALLCLPLGLAAWRAVRADAGLRALVGWALLLLLLGLAFEPYEGGIQKGIATFSYYLVGAACGMLLLVCLLIAIEVRGWRRGWTVLTGAGQNPLLAYTAVHTLLAPLLLLTGVGALVQVLTVAPWAGLLRAAGWTWLLCAFAGWCARRRWILRV